MNILPHLGAIVKLVSSNPVVEVISPTGSGKSIALPAALARGGSRCYVTVPTRTAAESLAARQRLLLIQMHEDDSIVAYAANSRVTYTPDTRIAYITAGHARRKMLSYFEDGVAKDIDFCDVLMVDEVHTGSVDNSVVLRLWELAANAGKLVPKLVIATATPIPLNLKPTPVRYEVELPSYPIEFLYLPRTPETEEDAGESAAATALAYHQAIPPNGRNHILIFAAGAASIDRIMQRLGPSDGSKLVLPAYGALSPAELDLIYQEVPKTQRKVVVATNIGEMAVTIPDITCVVDTLYEKLAETSSIGGIRLQVTLISKDSARQRAGRTGRTGPGVCYRMCTEKFYQRLPDHREIEIHRLPLHEPLIEIIGAGLQPAVVFPSVEFKSLQKQVKLLQELSLITTFGERIRVTEKGYFATQLPLSVRASAFLWNWIYGLRFSAQLTDPYVSGTLAPPDYSQIEVTEGSLATALLPAQLSGMNEVYTQLGSLGTILDLEAGVGTDTIFLRELYPLAQIDSTTSDVPSYRALEANLADLATILKRQVEGEHNVYNLTPREYLAAFDLSAGPAFDLMVIRSLDLLNYAPLARNTLLILPSNTKVPSIQGALTRNLQGRKVVILPTRSNEELTQGNPHPANPPRARPAEIIYPGLVLAAALECYGPSYLRFPRKEATESDAGYRQRLTSYIQDTYADILGYSEVETIIKLWLSLPELSNAIRADQRVRDRSLEGRCQKLGYDFVTVKAFYDKVSQLYRRLHTQGYQFDTNVFPADRLVLRATPALKSAFFDREVKLDPTSKAHRYRNSKGKVFKLDNLRKINTYGSNLPPELLAIAVTERPSKYKQQKLTRTIELSVPLALPVTFTQESLTFDDPNFSYQQAIIEALPGLSDPVNQDVFSEWIAWQALNNNSVTALLQPAVSTDYLQQEAPAFAPQVIDALQLVPTTVSHTFIRRLDSVELDNRTFSFDGERMKRWEAIPTAVLAQLFRRYWLYFPREVTSFAPVSLYRLLTSSYGVTSEGFTTPLTSVLPLIKPEYTTYSLFAEDAPSFSAGQLFNLTVEDLAVVITLHYNLLLLPLLLSWLQRQVATMKNFRCFLLLPRIDTVEYTSLFEVSNLLGHFTLPNTGLFVDRFGTKATNEYYGYSLLVYNKGWPIFDLLALQAEIAELAK